MDKALSSDEKYEGFIKNKIKTIEIDGIQRKWYNHNYKFYS